jgi:glycerophosphoryl diester phosphodiesterase
VRAQGEPPLLFGHRGASELEIENTLAAFRRAMTDGADGVELDVQRCASGEIVVFHDDDLSRLSGRRERIAELPLPALREVRLRGTGEIPTLAEALEACAPSGLVNIEIKHTGFFPRGCAALVDGVAEAVAKANAGDRVLVSSFSVGALLAWRRRRPDLPCGLLFEPPPALLGTWPPRTDLLLPLLRPSAVHPEKGLCTDAAVRRWLRRGYTVNVWTVDDPSAIARLAAMGASGIITNNPGKARSVLSAPCCP